MSNSEIVIVGGGVVGLTAALAMAKCGHRVVVLDAHSLELSADVEIDKRVYAINKASHQLFNKLGVWQYIEAQRYSPYQRMHVWDESYGGTIEFDARSIGAPDLGYIIEESVIKNALLQAIKENSLIDLVPNQMVTTVHQTEDYIEIGTEQQRWQGRLLIVAEGANSPTRERLDVQLTSWSYKQQAIVASVNTATMHKHTAYQVFTKKGPLAFLPLMDEHSCSIVWSLENCSAESMMKLSNEEFNAELSKQLSPHLGEIKLRSARHCFPLHMRHVKKYVGSRWLLMGDTAHTIHPLAGLGLNIGLADVTAWLKLVEMDKNSLVSKKMLGMYQRERKSAVWQNILLMESFKQLFSVSLTPITVLRNLGLQLCNQSDSLKRLFIYHAAGVEL